VRIVFASGNPGKSREVSAILGASGHEVVAMPMFIGEIESGTSYLENARIKAWSVARLLPGHAVLGDDAGVEIDALGGLPGVHSAYFAGPSARADDNVDKVLRLLDAVPDEERTGRYRVIALLVLPSGAEVIGEGVLEGRFVTERRGDGGFGYDPIFVPDGDTRTVAELRSDEKNVMSHRARALRDLLSKL
jgi:non-canonical purine NTP pyrophosphatase (RdgB/HAM1 family)